MISFNFFLRNALYLSIFAVYLWFMKTFAPLGIDWLPFHSNRVSNFIEYLEINGYVTNFGFSIWTECQDCDLKLDKWDSKIYFSGHALMFSPYIFLTYFFGIESVPVLGPWVDRIVIFLTSLLLSEFLIKAFKNHSNFSDLFIGIGAFSIFISSPWVYKMILAGWTEIYFAFFFMCGLLLISNKSYLIGYIFTAIAALFNPTWALVTSVFYILMACLPYFFHENKDFFRSFYPSKNFSKRSKFILVGSLLMPALFIMIIKVIASGLVGSNDGSSILFRVGISGFDIHNGGILGALQFLGGNRISHCLAGSYTDLPLNNMESLIGSYNCIFSISGMWILSVFGFIGSILLIKNNKYTHYLFVPLMFSLVWLFSVFQQSFSVHLMGYSYIFAIFFTAGMAFWFTRFSIKFSSQTLSIIFLSPILAAIVIMSIRVSMLTGVNG